MGSQEQVEQAACATCVFANRSKACAMQGAGAGRRGGAGASRRRSQPGDEDEELDPGLEVSCQPY